MNFLHHLSNPHYYESHCHVQEHIQSKANTRTMSKSTHQEIHHTLHICPYIARNTFCDKAMQQHTTCQTKFSSIFNVRSKSLSIDPYLFQSSLSSHLYNCFTMQQPSLNVYQPLLSVALYIFDHLSMVHQYFCIPLLNFVSNFKISRQNSWPISKNRLVMMYEKP